MPEQNLTVTETSLTGARDETQHTHCCPCGAQRTCTVAESDFLEWNEELNGFTLSCGHVVIDFVKPNFCVECGARVVE